MIAKHDLLFKDAPKSPSKFFSYSPIMGLFQCMVVLLWWVSLNEYFKFIGIYCANYLTKCSCSDTKNSTQTSSCKCIESSVTATEKNIALTRSYVIDLYEIVKWAIIIYFIVFNVRNTFGLLTTTYLLASNLFGHFYYHIWKDKPVSGPKANLQSRRRFISFTLSLFFIFVAYGHIFSIYECSFAWPLGGFSRAYAILFSISNAFTLVYGSGGPLDSQGYYLAISEVVYTFFFVVVIITESLPNKLSR